MKLRWLHSNYIKIQAFSTVSFSWTGSRETFGNGVFNQKSTHGKNRRWRKWPKMIKNRRVGFLNIYRTVGCAYDGLTKAAHNRASNLIRRRNK